MEKHKQKPDAAVTEDIRMRCHVSIIFESLWQFWLVIVLMLFNELDSIIDLVKEVGEDGVMEMLRSGGLWGILVLAGLTAIVLGFQFFRWRKTWVSLESNLLTVERNTLRRVKNTITIENISAVNMERNLFERVVGTCRIKIDTNSLTTANETDISLVFSMDKAIMLRRAILMRVAQKKDLAAGEGAASGLAQAGAAAFGGAGASGAADGIASAGNGSDGGAVQAAGQVYRYSPKDMVLHCLYSLSMFSVLVTIAGIGFFVWGMEYFGASKMVDILLGGAWAAALMIVGAAWSLISKFITYYGFTVYRTGKDLRLRYGLIKQRSYTIPVDKIAALKIEQPLISRVFHRYQAQVVTVGFGDEDGESANLTMAVAPERFMEQLAVLLPEYYHAGMLEGIRRQDSRSLRIKGVKMVKWTILIAALAAVLIGVVSLPARWVCLGGVGVLVSICLLYVLAHLASGYRLESDRALLAHGVFARHMLICTYPQMQYITLNVHPFGRRYHIVCGTISLLNATAAVPYMDEKQAVWLAEQLISARKGA